MAVCCQHTEEKHDAAHPVAAEDFDCRIRKLGWVWVMMIVFLGVQYMGANASGSNSLHADANHMLSDVGAIGLALVSAFLAKSSFAHHRPGLARAVENGTALFNGLMLTALALMNLLAIAHLFESHEHVHVSGTLMLVIASARVLVNLFAMSVLHGDHGRNPNILAVQIHIMADFLSSASVLVGALLIFFWDIQWVDTVFGFAISIYVLLLGCRLVFEILRGYVRPALIQGKLS